jgi:DNA-binding beta-propeller fold protein YncE
LATDRGGNVYVADWNRIQKFDADGNFLAAWGQYGQANGQFSDASGVAVDAAGRVFVADSGNKRIQVFTSTGGFLAAWSTYQSGGIIRSYRRW